MKENEEPDVQQKPGVQIRLRPQSIHAASLSLSSTHNISFSLFSAEPPRKSPTGAEMKNREEHTRYKRAPLSLSISIYFFPLLSLDLLSVHIEGETCVVHPSCIHVRASSAPTSAVSTTYTSILELLMI